MPVRAARLHARFFLKNVWEELTMKSRTFERVTESTVSRRALLQAGAGLLGSTMLAGSIPKAFAEPADQGIAP